MTLKHFCICAGLEAKVNNMEMINKVNSIVHCGGNTGVKQVSTGNEMTRTQSFQATCYCSDSVTFIMVAVIFLTYANVVLRLLVLFRRWFPYDRYDW